MFSIAYGGAATYSTMADDSRLLTYTVAVSPSHALTVVADPCGAVFPSPLGAGLWHAATELAEFAATVPTRDWWETASVVELGAGCGVPGATAALCGAGDVCLTDTAAGLPCLQANVDANASVLGDARVSIAELDWRAVEEEGALPPAVPFTPTLVLAADVAYDADAWPGLAATLAALLASDRSAQAWLALPEREESSSFLPTALAPAGLAWRPLRRCPPRGDAAHAVTLWQVWRPGGGASLCYILDFDQTLIDENSDTVALAALDAASASTSATDAMQAVYRAGGGWTAAMDAGLAAGAAAVGDADAARRTVLDAVNGIHMSPRVAGALTAASAAGHRVAVVSDANAVFIRERLKAAAVSVTTTITNGAAWRPDGSLAVTPAVPAHEPHGCPACPANLCKGRVVEKELVSSLPHRLIVAGDGANDACAAARTGPHDVVLVRSVYPPDGRPTKLAAMREEWARTAPRIVPWVTADDLGAALEGEIGAQT